MILVAWIGLGLCATGILCRILWPYDYTMEWYEFAGRKSTGLIAMDVISPIACSLCTLLGTAVFFLAVFYMRRRFSLRFLMLAVFLSAALATIPVLEQDPATRSVRFVFRFDRAMDEQAMQALESELLPEKAFATLPDDLVKQFNADPRTWVKAISLRRAGPARISKYGSGGACGDMVRLGQNQKEQTAPEEKPGVDCRIEFLASAPKHHRIILYEFYANYFYLFSLREAISSSVLRDHSPFAIADQLGHGALFVPSSAWSSWAAEWTLKIEKMGLLNSKLRDK